MNGWLSVQEAARLCGTDEQRITLWMNGNHIAYACFDTVLMIDGASLFALFERNRVAPSMTMCHSGRKGADRASTASY